MADGVDGDSANDGGPCCSPSLLAKVNSAKTVASGPRAWISRACFSVRFGPKGISSVIIKASLPDGVTYSSTRNRRITQYQLHTAKVLRFNDYERASVTSPGAVTDSSCRLP